MADSVWAGKFLISGGTGLIGSALCQKITAASGHAVVLSRRAERLMPSNGLRYVGGIDEIPLDSVFDVVINLAGENIAASRWSHQQKHALLESRLQSTSALTQLLEQLEHKPKLMLSASAVGYYGNRGDELLDESSVAGSGFSSELCLRWEAEAAKVERAGVRLAISRFAPVLSAQGGAWREMCKPVVFKLSPRYGNGQQYMSWISIDDVLSALAFIIQGEFTGIFNVVSPAAMTQADFAQQLAVAGGAFVRPSVPAPLLRIILGQMADELLLVSQRVLPKRLLALGFQFGDADLSVLCKKLFSQ